jgi:hypothetical protein
MLKNFVTWGVTQVVSGSSERRGWRSCARGPSGGLGSSAGVPSGARRWAWPRALVSVRFRGRGVWGWRHQDLEALVSMLVVGRGGAAP